MPRVNPMRSVTNEENLAQRIQFEREQRGWTYERLAKRMSDAGFSIQTSAMQKIEKGKPRRKVTVDELVGFAAIFETEVQDLLLPIEIIHDRQAREVLETWKNAQAALVASIDQAVASMVNFYQLPEQSRIKLTELTQEPGAHHEYVNDHTAPAEDANVTFAAKKMDASFTALVTAMGELAAEHSEKGMS